MEEIQAIPENSGTSESSKSEAQPKGSMSSNNWFYGAFLVFLGLLSVFLLALLVSSNIYCNNYKQRSAAKSSAVQHDLKTKLQACQNDVLLKNHDKDKLLYKLGNCGTNTSTGPVDIPVISLMVSNQVASWEEARRNCFNQGAGLVTIGSRKFQELLTKMTNVETPVWIGFTDKEEEGNWKWTIDPEGNDTYWKEGQPDNGGDGNVEENCAQMTIGGDSLDNWNDLSCSTKLRWICEKTQWLSSELFI